MISDEELTELEDLMSDPEDKHVLKLITPQHALALISEIRRLREENAAWKELNTGLAKFIYSGVYSDSVLNHKALRPGKGGDADAG